MSLTTPAARPAAADPAAPDPTFPVLHIRPARGWVNDPNGVALVDGTFHVFFQLNPHDPRHRAIHWGHASSTDLLSWREEPVALRPRPGELDSFGCWTGSVVDDDGVPTAVYSAVAADGGAAEVVLARSDRTLRRWEQQVTSVVGMPVDDSLTDVRDPFVFSHEGRRYAIQGAGHREGRPRILLYGCDDLTRWTELGTLLDGDQPVARQHADANVWECPNLVRVGGRWVLVLSLWRWVDGAHQLSGVSYLVGDLLDQGAGLRFEPTSGGALDGGPTFYAPQLLAGEDRVLVWAWAWEHGRSEQEVEQAGWAGVLTYPRELVRDGGRVWLRPAAELVGLRRGQLRPDVDGRVDAHAFEVVATSATRLLLSDPQGESLVVEVVGSRQEPARVLVDGSLVEAFTGAGSSTTRAYPGQGRSWVLRWDGDAPVVHRLGTPPPGGGPAAQV